ncbi:MAG: ComF family protein [Gammaproteobacteria bacterium]|nr:ComF family protein [Gammaproteobacteria bacterium]
MIYKWLKSNLRNAIPRQCVLCLTPTGNPHLLCAACEKELPKNTAHCIICAAAFPATLLSTKPLVCGKCQAQPPSYETSVIPYLYAAPLKQLITGLKFHADLSSVPLLANSFHRELKRNAEKLPECIIPVPLHKQRLKERGFNQAIEIARLIALQIKIPLEISLCQRSKVTPYQSGLSAKQRKQNLKNAFTIAKEHPYKHVAIFDDVVTTGTTVNELAKQLKKSGVKIIEVWAIARTINKQ